jgi:sec-independent protein translocase protein TatB
MLDIGGWEFLVVAFVLVMVVGPKELPKMLRSFTAIMQQIRRTAADFSRSMTDLANEADVAELKKTLDQAKTGNLSDIANAIDPGGDVGSTVDSLASTVKAGGTGDDLGDIGKIAKAAGDDMAAATTKPDIAAASTKPTPKKAPAKKRATKTEG